jgi:hypothetical protein
MTTDAATSPDAFADALMDLLGEPEGGESVPSQEGQAQETPSADPEPPAPQDEQPTPEPQADDFETRYAARRQAEATDQERVARLAELEKLIEEGEDAEVGKRFRQEYSQLKNQSVVTQQVAKQTADSIFEKSLDQEFIDGLSDQEAIELHGLVQKLDVPKFLQRVIEIKGAKASTTDIDALVEQKVQEKLQAAQNAQRGQQVKAPSPSAVPAAQDAKVPTGATNDDLWAAAFSDLAEDMR